MAKAPKTAYVCNDCGAEFSRWQGQCSACKAWNTISEVRLISASNSAKMIVLVVMQEKPVQKSKHFLKLAYKKHRVSPVDLKN